MQPHPIHDPLMLAAPPVIEAPSLAEALRRDWGLDGALRPLGGERDRNFRLDRADAPPLLVKLAHPDENPAITGFQTAALLHLEGTAPDVPLPRMLRARDGTTERAHPAADGRACLLRVLTYLPGRPVAPPVPARALGDLTARLDAALAGFSHPADRRRLLWDIREAPSLRELLPDVADLGLRALAEAALDRFEDGPAAVLAALPMQVIHNDLNPHNVLADEGGSLAGIIDFGDMVRAPLLQEVATACAYLVQPGEAPLAGPAAFLAGYRAVLPLPGDQIALLPALIATRMAVTVLISHWRARRQPENAPYILRNMPGARAGLESLSRGADARAFGG
ncbi:phosphotransferase [Pararoseomonas indoligenes]|uniref:Hydroxylysine kinase n=1 Tax=Roseomonas indoligenes TaxID=2820811 RepID=A0A940S8S7_9PROT|nr:phosphotransferase [Pararoseomonas indoligenes]MBP0496409.1 phosphotransferase [Pararoseomonas indoligenes]